MSDYLNGVTRKRETIAGRCLDPEYREGFVRGYQESASELLDLVEHLVSNDAEISEIRQRFADRIYGVADMIEQEVLTHPDYEQSEDDTQWQSVRMQGN